MIPVDQTSYGADGDCFRACLASILELPLDAVPHFPGEDWHEQYVAWLAGRGLGMVTLRIQDPHWPPAFAYGGYAILAVDSPRLPGRFHGVVIQGGAIVHDPHPDRHLGVGAWREVTLLTVLDPARPICIDDSATIDTATGDR